MTSLKIPAKDKTRHKPGRGVVGRQKSAVEFEGGKEIIMGVKMLTIHYIHFEITKFKLKVT